MRILNKLVRWNEAGIHYEADQRTSELICESLELKEDSKSVLAACERNVVGYERT